MSIDVTELQKRINSIISQDADAPTAGGDDWNLNLMYLNMSQNEWAEAYGWPTLYKEVNTMTSQATGNVTLSLPSDYRKLDGFLKINEGTDFEYPLIDPTSRSQYAATDKYCYLLGYPGNYSLVINPMPGSGASILYSYWASPASLASPTNVSLCPDPAYLVQRSIAYLWESRDDGRFPQAKAESEKILSRMLEFEVTKGHSYDNTIKTEEFKSGFRIGRN